MNVMIITGNNNGVRSLDTDCYNSAWLLTVYAIDHDMFMTWLCQSYDGGFTESHCRVLWMATYFHPALTAENEGLELHNICLQLSIQQHTVYTLYGAVHWRHDMGVISSSGGCFTCDRYCFVRLLEWRDVCVCVWVCDPRVTAFFPSPCPMTDNVNSVSMRASGESLCKALSFLAGLLVAKEYDG